MPDNPAGRGPGTVDPRVGGARDVVGLLAALQASDPGRPRLTWYGPDGERVELSARVLTTWVAKTANLLVEELEAGPHGTVVLDLPAHWRTAVWALASWAVGADVAWDPLARSRSDAAPARSTDAGVLVTDRPSTAPPSTRQQVAVALPALARSFDGDPGTALDYAGVVAGFGDVFVPFGPLHHVVLLDEARSAWPPGVRLLCVDGALDLRRDLLGALLADGSVVLCHAEPPAAVVASERVSARSAPGPGG